MSARSAYFTGSDALACFVFGLCYAGYSFIAWGWPAVDGYPAIERFLDPGYLHNDFYVNTNNGYGVDSNLAWVFGNLELWTGVPYESALAALNLVRCISLPFALFFFFRTLTGSRDAALWGVFLGTVANFALPHTVAWSWLAGDPSPVMLTVPLVLFAWGFVLARRIWPAALVLALTCVFHPLIAVHGAAAAGIAFLIDYSAQERRAALAQPVNWAAGAALAAITLAQYAALSPASSERLPIEEYASILVNERHPGDFLVSHFGRARPVALALELSAAILFVRIMSTAAPRPRLLAAILIAALATALASFVFVDLAPTRFAVSFTPYRFIAGLAPFMLVTFGAFAAHEASAGRWLSVGVMLAAFLLASPLTPWLGVYLPLPTAGALLLALALARTFVWKADTGRSPANETVQSVTPWAAAGLALLAAAPVAYERRSEFVIPTSANQHPIYAWAAAHTPAEAVFLLDQFASDWPYAAALSPQKMRLVGRRAVVASLDFPFLDRDMREWRQRWLIGLGGGAPDFVNAAGHGELSRIAGTFPFDYVVRNAELEETQEFTLAARYESWRGVGPVYVYARAPLRSR